MYALVCWMKWRMRNVTRTPAPRRDVVTSISAAISKTLSLSPPFSSHDQVANKAKEALEFQQTSAYMFFEEKLPELKEEFGLKKYIEVNQEPGGRGRSLVLMEEAG